MNHGWHILFSNHRKEILNCNPNVRQLNSCKPQKILNFFRKTHRMDESEAYIQLNWMKMGKRKAKDS
uniref:Uncharacterized protein n=1 Tax=Onchocerca volvulus TaxID=6282 RepID=A0A2K6VPU3_ONCVO